MRALILLVGFSIFAAGANTEKVLTGQEIYRVNHDAVVQIGTGNNFSGDGFIVSADGIIVTANHVVTTRESGFRQYVSDIRVRVVRNGVASMLPAMPIKTQVSEDQVNFDSALLKIAGSNLPHVTLGDWSEVDIDGQITILPSFPGPETLMLQGSVSGKASAQTDLGPKLVNTIFFQAPVRNGFSGSPIFSSKGNVVGIVDTKVFGISPTLDAVRKQLAANSTQTTVIIQGVSFAPAMTELINVLDQNLISGLGSGVAIEYAKKQQEAKEK